MSPKAWYYVIVVVIPLSLLMYYLGYKIISWLFEGLFQ